jgi:hypothetical protein
VTFIFLWSGQFGRQLDLTGEKHDHVCPILMVWHSRRIGTGGEKKRSKNNYDCL